MKLIHAHLALLTVLAATAVALLLTHPPKTAVVAGGTVEALTAAPAATSADTHYPPSWRQRLLALLGAPGTRENLKLLSAWGNAEGGTARWDPLNATYPLPFGESWPYNGSSVQSYWRPTGGIAATALIMIQDNYACIVGALQGGKLTAEQIVNKCSAAFRTWGTSTSTMLAVLKRA